mgnify:CR=1 FL=1
MNAADQRSVRKAKQRERQERDQELKDLRDVLSTRQGRRFIWRTLTLAGVFRLSFVPGEPEETAFNEGRRSLGLSLMADVHEIDAAQYIQMANEANGETLARADELEPVNTESLTEEHYNA